MDFSSNYIPSLSYQQEEWYNISYLKVLLVNLASLHVCGLTKEGEISLCVNI